MTSDGSAEQPGVEFADIEKWYRRFDRAVSMFSPDHDADGFNDLVAVSIAGVTLEAFLHIGIGIVDPDLHGIALRLGASSRSLYSVASCHMISAHY